MRVERSHRAPGRGFTLIELLIVVAVLVVLISLLLPSLQKAKQQGQRAACAGGLRQFGMAIRLYMNDNSGWLPTAAGPTNGGFGSDEITVANDGWWTATNAAHPTPTWVNYSFPELWNRGYVTKRSMAFCPAYDNAIRASSNYWFGWVYGTGTISSATTGGIMGYQYLTWTTAQGSMYYGTLIGQGGIKQESAWNGANGTNTTPKVAIMQDTVTYSNPWGPQLPPYTTHGTWQKPEGGNILKGDGTVIWVPYSPTRWPAIANGYCDYADLTD